MLHRRTSLKLSVVLSLLAGAQAFAIPVVYMATTGNNANDGSTPALAKLTLEGATGALAAVDSGGQIIMAAGAYAYNTSAAITISNPVTISGAQAGVDARPSAPTSSSRTQSPTPSNPNPGAGESVFTFGGTNGQFIIGSNGVVFDGLWINRTVGGADIIQVADVATLKTGFAFRNCVLTGDTFGDDAMNLNSLSAAIIENNYIFDFPTCAIKVRGVTGPSNGVIVRNNEIQNCRIASTSNGQVFLLENATNILVEGNTIYNGANGYGVALGNSNDAAAISVIPAGTVVGNTITNCFGGIVTQRSGSIIMGNTISAVPANTSNISGIHLKKSTQAGTSLNNITVTNNTLTNISHAAGTTSGGGLFIAANVPAAAFSTMTISCNSFTNITPAGILSLNTTTADASNNYWGGAAPTSGLQAPPTTTQTRYNGNLTVTGALTTPPSYADLVPSSSSLSFGPISSASTADLPVNITNTGSCTTLTINSPGLTFSGTDAGKFSFASAPTFPIVLAPGASTTFNLRYTPGGVSGPHSATATLVQADSIAPYFATVALAGSTSAPPPTLAAITLSDADGLNSPGAEFTNALGTTVTFGAIGGGTATTIQLSEDNTFTTGVTTVNSPFPSSTTFNLSAGDGAKTVYARIQGPGGDSTPVNDGITLDTIAPVSALSSAVANGGFTSNLNPVSFTASFTDANTVTGFDPATADLTLSGGSASNPSNAGNNFGFDITPGAFAVPVTLNVEGGAAFDSAGNANTASASYSFTAIQPPTLTAITLSDADGTNDPLAGQTNNATVTVALGTLGGGAPTFIDVSEDNTFTTGVTSIAYASQSSVPYTILGTGTVTVYARVRNNGGASAPVSSTITLDTTSPAQAIGGELTVVGGGSLDRNSIDVDATVTFTEDVDTFVTSRSTGLTVNGVTLAASTVPTGSLGVSITGSNPGPWNINVTGTTPSTGNLTIGLEANRLIDGAGSFLDAGVVTPVTFTITSGVAEWSLLD